ncbi:RNA-directed DNA polymerase [Methylovorus mays]|uniref:RNA-directed DNA polymerase n=1 Tax=Methylovorus mays TaxID=184077 RepID=UPI001E5893C8|nr:RNA-directed DNA polymerase [Methylovorus mays]MCB5207724.1 RNA-directed DNA polymerase [Methylovorus mays]
MSKIENLIKRGMFPSQLPPSFTTTQFGEKHLSFTRRIKTKEKLSNRLFSTVRPEIFSVARYGHFRRLTTIVNPIAYHHIAQLLSNNWRAVERQFKKAKLSKSNPKITDKGGRSIEFTPIKELQEIKIKESAGYKYVLKSDISQFFPTLYTHTIGWALDGKDIAKKKQYKRNLHSNDFGILLDKSVGFFQSNQTIGLPIGPDTSHIIAELVATGVDEQLIKKLGYIPAGFRFVDDYYLFFESKDKAEDSLAKLTSSMSYYELKINSIKTEIMEIELLAEETWKYSLQQFSFEYSKKNQRNSINHYFDLAYRSAKNHTDENVMVYAVKKLKSQIIKKENWDLFEAYLCRILLTYPNTIQDISQILTTYQKYDYPLNDVRLKRTINQIIIDHALFDHHSEIAWALWLSKSLKIKLTKKSCESLNQINSSVALIIAVDLENSGLLEGELDNSRIINLANIAEIWGTNWLLAYELRMKEWLGFSKSSLLSDNYYGILAGLNIHFYDQEKILEPIFAPAESTVTEGNPFNEMSWNELFESDEDLSDLFDFTEESEGYGDIKTSDPHSINLGDDEFIDDIPF